MANAFELRAKEEYLSVNWLEYFEKLNLDQAIDCVRDAFQKKNYRIGINGKFVSLKVSEVKRVISDHGLFPFRIECLPAKDDPSHSDIFGYTSSDEVVSLAIKDLVRLEDVYPAKYQENRLAQNSLSSGGDSADREI